MGKPTFTSSSSYTAPVDPSLSGYQGPMAGLSGVSDPTAVSSAALRNMTPSVKAPVVSMTALPEIPGLKGHQQGKKPGSNASLGQDPESPFSKLLGNVGTGVGIFADLMGVWQGFKAQKMAQHQFSSQLAFANQNLGNEVKSYNNQYKSMIDSRFHTEGKSQADAAARITADSLKFTPIKG